MAAVGDPPVETLYYKVLGTPYVETQISYKTVSSDDVQMATTIRRALLSIVSAIEKRYDLPDSRERSNYCNKRKNGV